VTPTAKINHLASLLSAELMGREGYCQHSAYLAKAEFDDRVREMVTDGSLMAFAVSHEVETGLRVRPISRDEMYLPPNSQE
jgi:hypothetical protein